MSHIIPISFTIMPKVVFCPVTNLFFSNLKNSTIIRRYRKEDLKVSYEVIKTSYDAMLIGM